MADVIVMILLFLLGASVGSFLSVVLYRIKNKKKGIIFGHSYCPSCRKKLSFADLIPIASYIALRGQCRNCGKKIPPHYFFLELICGFVILSIYLQYPFITWLANGTPMPDVKLLISFIFYSLYGFIFIGIFFYDLQTYKIPDLFLFPLIGLSIIGTLLTGSPDIASALAAVCIALVFFGGQLYFSKGKWLGEGDLYLSVAMAIIFGWQLFIVAVVVSYFLGALISIPLLAANKAKLKSAVPFGPFLILGSFVSVFFGQDLIDFYLRLVIF